MQSLVILFAQTKGGTGKTLNAFCLAFSGQFRDSFSSVALVELDPQGTLKRIWEQRINSDLSDKNVSFYSFETSDSAFTNRMGEVLDKHHVTIIDLPGESISRFATKVSISLADIVIIPCRSSTYDEDSLETHILPIIENDNNGLPEKGRFFVLPTFIHPKSKAEFVKMYFDGILPSSIKCLPLYIPNRGVYENFSRGGLTLEEYRKTVLHKKSLLKQADKAIQDFSKLSTEILNRIKSKKGMINANT